MPDAVDTPALLAVADVARLRGCDHSTAWRLLTTLEREYGCRLVREKRTLYIAHDELRTGLARIRGFNEKRLARELAVTRRRVAALEAWKKATEDELREFRRQAHEWFRRRA